jgi:hypothetical protein
MHDTSVAPYPRQRGVVVPAILTRAGCPVVFEDSSAEARARAADETVRWVKMAMRRLPPEVLDAELPDPGFVLRSWALAARTRGALARLGDPDRARSWRVRDLLGAARLGPATLVDLLAAREEHAANEGEPVAEREPSPSPSRLDGLAAAITRQLPMRPEELPALVAAAGFTNEPRDADAVARIFRDWRVPVPFRSVRRGGVNLLVAPTSLASVEALVSAASQTIFHWGLCSVGEVVDRLRTMAAPQLGADMAARVLSASPSFRWLDESSGWFSFVGANSRVSLAIRKIFAVVERVSVTELAEALGKRVKALATAPRAAIESYLSEVADCAVQGEWVRPRRSFVPSALADGERLIVDVLRSAGGRLTRAALRRQALAAGVKVTTLRDFLRTSPLVVVGQRDLRLVGVSV